MAQKPTTSLPDVFARPGAAPARGTPIEELPMGGAEPAAAVRVEPEPAAVEPAKPEPAKVEAVKPEPAPLPQAPLRPAAPPPPRPAAPPPVMAADPPNPPARGSAWTIAVVALAVSLTSPLWFDSVVSVFGITTSVSRAQQEDAVAISRQEKQLQQFDRRLSDARADLAKVQSDLTLAARRQEESTVWMRIMAFARLAEALRRTMPFTTEIAMVRGAGAVAPDLVPLIERVGPYAPIGVPSAGDLDKDFMRLADPIIRPSRGLNPLNWIPGWLPFSRPPAEPDPTRLAVRDAAANVAEGNYQGAIVVLRQVQGPIGEGFAGWIEDVQARQAADTIQRRADDLIGKAPRTVTR